jgi:hypothetical protein
LNYRNIAQAKAIERKNKEQLLKVNPNLNENSGIYFLTREDEDGFKYAYIGQAVHILTRLSGHMTGYQHIDLSIKAHKFYSEDNPYGWKIGFLEFPVDQLDDMEQKYILQYANAGYQLRNKTSGSQGQGKRKIDEYKPTKGYRDGIAQGRKNLARELKHIIDTHLVVTIRPDKQGNKVSVKAYEKFNDLLNEGSENENASPD